MVGSAQRHAVVQNGNLHNLLAENLAEKCAPTYREGHHRENVEKGVYVIMKLTFLSFPADHWVRDHLLHIAAVKNQIPTNVNKVLV